MDEARFTPRTRMRNPPGRLDRLDNLTIVRGATFFSYARLKAYKNGRSRDAAVEELRMKKALAIGLIGLTVLACLALAGCQAASPEQGGRGRLIGDEPMVQMASLAKPADQGHAKH